MRTPPITATENTCAAPLAAEATAFDQLAALTCEAACLMQVGKIAGHVAHTATTEALARRLRVVCAR